ncbi:hypothetical protein ACRW2N_12250 [Escherichia coli]
MLGGADNPNGELPSYITGANNLLYKRTKVFGKKGFGIRVMCWARLRLIEAIGHE